MSYRPLAVVAYGSGESRKEKKRSMNIFILHTFLQRHLTKLGKKAPQLCRLPVNDTHVHWCFEIFVALNAYFITKPHKTKLNNQTA